MQQNCRGRRVQDKGAVKDHARHESISQAIAAMGETPQSLGLGDMTAAALDAVGITKERWAAWWGAPCGCKNRQDKLNKLGNKIVGWLKGETAA